VYGDPYTVIAKLKIVDGEAHIEDLLAVGNNFKSTDKRGIEYFIRRLGFKYYISSYFKNGVRVIEKIRLVEELEEVN
jgi:hypothetical protein